MVGSAHPSADDAEPILPELRKDITIERSGAFSNGAPSWLLHDGLRNKFFRIGEQAQQMLKIWKQMPLSEFITQVVKTYGRPTTKKDVEELVGFLFQNNLTVSNADADYKAFYKRDQSNDKGWAHSVMHGYLFFKIPLVKPQRFLDLTWPFVRPFFTRTFAIILGLLGFIGLYLTSRQWETFTNTFMNFLTFDGFTLYIVSLVFIKTCHELGHAYMAKKNGVPVPTIGVAFLVLFPILYTDTTAAARVTNSKDRLAIDLGGIAFELALAVIATLFWVFLPDGPLRSIAFTTATLSWLLSLAVNLNPFMRFDGYYIISDFLGLENLQQRSFEIARWKLREILFKPNRTPPEIMSDKLRRFLFLFAWGTWIYRFFLFLGIAVLVYQFFVKVVGIILFAVEIWWFIALPIWREMRVWWKEREEFFTRRFMILSAAIFAGLLLLFLPLSSSIRVTTLLKSSNQVRLFPPVAAQVVYVNLQPERLYKAGEVLIELQSADLEHEIEVTKKRLELADTRLRRSNSNQFDLSSIAVMRQERDSASEKLKQLNLEKAKLEMRAPFDGYLENIDTSLHSGQWLATSSSTVSPVSNPAASRRMRCSSAMGVFMQEPCGVS